MIQEENIEINEMILQIFEENETFCYPIETQREAKSFVRALNIKGLSYQAICHQIGEFEYNFDSWRKSVGRVGIGKRVIKLLNHQFEDFLNDSEEENAYIAELLRKRKEKMAEENRKFEEAEMQRVAQYNREDDESMDDHVSDSGNSIDSNECESLSSGGRDEDSFNETNDDADENNETEVDAENYSSDNLENALPAEKPENEMKINKIITHNVQPQQLHADLTYIDASGEDSNYGSDNEIEKKLDICEVSDKKENNDSNNNSKLITNEADQKPTNRLEFVEDNFDSSLSEDSNEGAENHKTCYQTNAINTQNIIITYDDFSTNNCDSHNVNITANSHEKENDIHDIETPDIHDIETPVLINGAPDSYEELMGYEESKIDGTNECHESKMFNSNEIFNVFEKAVSNLQEEFEKVKTYHDETNECVDDHIDENYNSDFENDDEELYKLYSKMTKTIKSHQNKYWSIYILSDSSGETPESRIKVGISRYPQKRLQQAQSFNPDIYQIACLPILDKITAIRQLQDQLSHFTYYTFKNWYEGPLEEMLKIITSISEQSSYNDIENFNNESNC